MLDKVIWFDEKGEVTTEDKAILGKVVRQNGTRIFVSPRKKPEQFSTTWEERTRSYQEMLLAMYTDWVEQTTEDVEQASPENRERVGSDAVDELVIRMEEIGRAQLTSAFLDQAQNDLISGPGKGSLDKIIEGNNAFIENSLAPSLKNSVSQALKGALLSAGGALAFASMLGAFKPRVAQYAGAHWQAQNEGLGERIRANEEEFDGRRVMRELDPNAEHCTTCPPKARVYDSWDAMVEESGIPGDGTDECYANCRCIVLVEDEPGSGNFLRM